jgi:SP family general alpha glucoside:H+ symporter-like MFS transporter
MTSDNMEKQTSAHEVEAAKGEPIYDADQKVDYDRAGAIEAERVEHDMTVLQAVKAYPAASWWAFVMSCTIVSSLLAHDRQVMAISLT